MWNLTDWSYKNTLNTEVTDKKLLPKFASIMEHWPSGQNAGFSIQGSQAQNHWVTQPCIFPRSTKWAPGSLGDVF